MTMAESLGALIRRAAATTGSPLADEKADALATWIELVEKWNARMDLTAARSREELVDLMVADALMLAGRIAKDAQLVDVGTGAGAPGLALAVLRQDLQVTLVEPLGKRASFLSTVAGALGRRDLTIERARGEALSGRRLWNVAVSRATLGPDAWLELGSKLVDADGCVWVLLGKAQVPVCAGWRAVEDLEYEWPLTGVSRRGLGYRPRPSDRGPRPSDR
jgi:16S rRNA (guanine527-N7)-methyltransferase